MLALLDQGSRDADRTMLGIQAKRAGLLMTRLTAPKQLWRAITREPLH